MGGAVIVVTDEELIPIRMSGKAFVWLRDCQRFVEMVARLQADTYDPHTPSEDAVYTLRTLIFKARELTRQGNS